MLADRGAADGDENVGGAAGAGKRDQALSRVLGNAEAHRLAALRLDQSGESGWDRGDDLIARKLSARRHHLIAGGEDRDFRFAADGKLGVVHGGGEHQLARAEPEAGLRAAAPRPRLKSWPRGRMWRRGAASLTMTTPRARLGVLLDDDGVGALRHRSASEDADGLALPDLARGNHAPARDSPASFSVDGSVATSAARTA